MNQYGYAGGDPVNYSDPFGLKPEIILTTPQAEQAAAECQQIASCKAVYDSLDADSSEHYVTTGPLPAACSKFIAACTQADAAGGSLITLNPKEYPELEATVGVDFTPGIILGHELMHALTCRTTGGEKCARQGENVMRAQAGMKPRPLGGN
jgi:hypothetical protein